VGDALLNKRGDVARYKTHKASGMPKEVKKIFVTTKMKL